MTGPAKPPSDRGRNAGIGCLMLPLGAASGAMVAVLVSKIVAFFLKVPDCAEGMSVPCFWYKYAGVGALFGALTLPTLVLWRLAGPRSAKPK
jgi:hypothetical protein